MGFERSEVNRVNVRLLGSRRVREFQKLIISPSNIVNKRGGGGQYEGVATADKVMVAYSPNCLLRSRQVDNLQISP